MKVKATEILLVEDNPDHVELALHVLNNHKIANRIHVARDGAEALDFLFGKGEYEGRNPTEDAPRVILLDLKLPLVDGLEVLRAIKKDSRTRMIPVVVFTSSTEERDMVESYRLGVNSFIVKPVDFEQFSDCMRDIGLYWLLLNESPRP
ncbi:MAG TPA: response regulator [Rhodothermales bacterium]|nr:response regulator [Rhodothermales bacterium]